MTSTLEEREAVIAAIKRHGNPDGTVPNRLVRPAADRLGVSQRQVRRYLREGVTHRTAFVPDDSHIDALYAAAGNVRGAYRICVELGFITTKEQDRKHGIGERQFRRGFEHHADAAIVAAASEGWSGFVSRRAYGTKFVPHKGHTYASDSSPLDLLCFDKKGGTVIDLWETNLVDEWSRFALVVATTNGHPDTEVAIAVFAAGINGYDADDGTPLGGIPDHVLTDNGGEYKNQAVTTGLIRCGFKLVVDGDDEATGQAIKRKFTEPESGWQNGRVERFNQTIQRGFSAELPGYVDSRLPTFERLKKRDYWKANPHLLLTRDQVDALLQRWLMRYNFETPHHGLDGEMKGMTPFEAWKFDDRVLTRPDERTLRLAMLSDDTRVVDKGKVRAFSTRYYSELLDGHHGRTVEIRYLPGRTENVEVFYLGQRLCTAIREDLLTDTYHSNLSQRRDKQTEAHLAHSLSGERLKTKRANQQLIDLGFDTDDLPAEPEETSAMRAAATRSSEPRPLVATAEEHAVLESLLPTEDTDEEYIA